MSDWSVGDLAVGDDSLPYCSVCATELALDPDSGAYTDGVLTVSAVIPPHHPETECGLAFVGFLPWEPPFCSCQFRKIRPDEQEACEPEFVTLLKRSKRKVSA